MILHLIVNRLAGVHLRALLNVILKKNLISSSLGSSSFFSSSFFVILGLFWKKLIVHRHLFSSSLFFIVILDPFFITFHHNFGFFHIFFQNLKNFHRHCGFWHIFFQNLKNFHRHFFLNFIVMPKIPKNESGIVILCESSFFESSFFLYKMNP